MNNFKATLDASMNASFLTGLILGQIKYNDDLSESDRLFLLNNLIRTHIDNPISSSDTIISECKELLEKMGVTT